MMDPESFRVIDSNPLGLVDFMLAIPNGLREASMVVLFTFIIGGMFMVIRKTGTIEVAVGKLTRRFSERSVIPVLIIVFAVIATLIGTQELARVYVPVILPLMIALRFDSVTAAAVALCATTAGFTSGVLNQINTGLGQQLPDLPLRAMVFIATALAGVAYVMRYAIKVRNNPESGLMHGDRKTLEKRHLYLHAVDEGALAFTSRQHLAGVTCDKWVRFFFPLFGIWNGIAMVFLVYAQATQWIG